MLKQRDTYFMYHMERDVISISDTPAQYGWLYQTQLSSHGFEYSELSISATYSPYSGIFMSSSFRPWGTAQWRAICLAARTAVIHWIQQTTSDTQKHLYCSQLHPLTDRCTCPYTVLRFIASIYTLIQGFVQPV